MGALDQLFIDNAQGKLLERLGPGQLLSESLKLERRPVYVAGSGFDWWENPPDFHRDSEPRAEEGSKPRAEPQRKDTGKNLPGRRGALTGDRVVWNRSNDGTPMYITSSCFVITLTIKLLLSQMSKPLKLESAQPGGHAHLSECQEMTLPSEFQELVRESELFIGTLWAGELRHRDSTHTGAEFGASTGWELGHF